MDIAVTWPDAINGTSAWVPKDRLPNWSRSRCIYWKCSQPGCNQSSGHVVDPQLPGLGEGGEKRTLRVTTEEALVHHAEGVPLRQGQIYVMFGSLVPVWHADFGRWEVQLPKCSPTSGFCRMLAGEAPTQSFNVGELFCGYMGGWSAAAEVMPRWRVPLALDINPQATATYVRNYGGRIITRPEKLDKTAVDENLVICHDVIDLRWLNALNYKDINVLTASAPCQSWSGMGSQSGTGSPNGQVLVATTQLARLLQPPFLLIEQVSGFRRHDEFDVFMHTMADAGFKLALSGVIDLAHYTCSTRRRWLGVFINTLNIARWDLLGRFISSGVRGEEVLFNPREHCLPFLTEEQPKAVTISDEDLAKLDDPELLPPWRRGCAVTRTQALATRIHEGLSTLPTINAAYRRAPDFSRDILKARGLMSWVVRDHHQTIRWLHKFEALRALGFGTHMVLPTDEAEAYTAVGNAISPMHAARAMSSAESMARAQQGGPANNSFLNTLQVLKDRQLDMQEAVVKDVEAGYQMLAFRMLHPGFQIRCPLCGYDSEQPLVQACQVCRIVACTACATTECQADHSRLREDSASDTAMDEEDLGNHEGSQFMITELGSSDVLFVGTQNVQSMLHFLQEHDMPEEVFKDGEQQDPFYKPSHLDMIYVTSAFEAGGECPNCHKHGQEGFRRICSRCNFVGCKSCIADSCTRCSPGKKICRRCHTQLAAKLVRAIHEDHAQGEDEALQTYVYDWEQVLQCEIEAQWQHLTVLSFPFGRTSIHRGMFADRCHILKRLAVAGYEPRGEQCIWWGTSDRPNLDHAVASYIIVVPRDELCGGLVPLVCKSHDEEAVLCLPNHQTANQWCESVLAPAEWLMGHFLVYGDMELAGNEPITFPAGAVLQKIAPWRRTPGDTFHTIRGQDERVTVPNQAKLPRTRSHHVTTMSGYVDLAGNFRAIPRPRSGQTWVEWLLSNDEVVPEDSWATCDGMHLPYDRPLSGEPMVMRLHYRVRGGAKEAQKSEMMHKKLSSHLREKGVPSEASEDRAAKIISTIGVQAVESAYASIDPWKALKEATKDRMRMVLQEELRASRAKTKQGKQDKGKDPWLHDNPWKQSSGSTSPTLQVNLVPGHFVDAQHVAAEARGVAILGEKEAETLAKSSVALSEDELAGIVIGVHQPTVGSRKCTAITLPVMQDCKILIRGFLIDFGARETFTKKVQHAIDITARDTAVIAVEVRREFIKEWDMVAQNPLKFVFNAIEGLQAATVTTWARRFYEGRQVGKAETATTWHAFVKVTGNTLDNLLPQSGKSAVFITPKQEESSAPSGLYRVAWLDCMDLDKAISMHRMYPELQGIVRGRSSLGLRMRAADYGAIRKKLDPSWSPNGMLTDIVINKKWSIGPVPRQVDKQCLQDALLQLGWRATPLRQVAAETWLIGANEQNLPPADTIELAGRLVLIQEQQTKKQAAHQDVVIAAPNAFRKNLKGNAASRSPIVVAVPPPLQDLHATQTPARGPTGTLMAEMKEELNAKLQDLQAEMQKAVNTVGARVTTMESQVATAVTSMEHQISSQDGRLKHVEASMAEVSSAMVTKLELSQALKEAFETQSRDIRHLLAKRSPDATPTHEAKASRTA